VYRNLPLESLVPNPRRANRMSRPSARKLENSIRRLGHYEAITVRPHPDLSGKFELLDGHSRLAALEALGVETAKCDIWTVDDREAELFLALLNRLKGLDVAELRMSLLVDLLQHHSCEDLAGVLPETQAALAQIMLFAEEGLPEIVTPTTPPLDVVILDFYLSREQHRVIGMALEDAKARFRCASDSEALGKLAEWYLSTTAGSMPQPDAGLAFKTDRSSVQVS